MLFLSADHHCIAVTEVLRIGGTKVPYRINRKYAAIAPYDAPGLHMTGRIKIGIYFDIDAFSGRTHEKSPSLPADYYLKIVVCLYFLFGKYLKIMFTHTFGLRDNICKA